MLYCLALEYARHGDLSTHLHHAGKGFTEVAARREIAGILEVLGKLHRGQMLHRDLTPLNVFVCEGRKLKLGDFGIARPQTDRRGVTARTLNPFVAPSDILDGTAPKWQARDDVYQVGQLLGMLITGRRADTGPHARRASPGVQRSPEGNHLPLHRRAPEAVRERRSPDRRAAQPARGAEGRRALRSLRGVHLFFTGILSKPRRDAVAAAKKAGAIVHSGPSTKTTVVVRGRPNAQQAAGSDAGLKLMEIRRLAAAGHRITLVTETQFWRLASRKR